MIVIGIDPGTSGAIAILDAETAELVDMTTLSTHKPGSRRRVDAHVTMRWIKHALLSRELEPSCQLGAIEQVNAFPAPNQGVSSAFSFGLAAGTLEGIIAGLGIPYMLVPPRAWTAAHNVPGKAADSHASLARARMLYPDAAIGRSRNKADAILIARYAIIQNRYCSTITA